MVAWRQALALVINDEELSQLTTIARSRTEPASRVERARILLAYRDEPSFFAVGQALGLHHQTVQRCVEKAVAFGPLAALDDRPRPGRERRITDEAKAWLVSLACRKAKELGYPHELWTTRLLARHAREHGPAAGHACLANLAQGTLCKILNQHEVKPHKVRYYLERRDADFEAENGGGSVRLSRGRCSQRGRAAKIAAEAETARLSRSSPTTRSRACRRSGRPRRTCRPSPASMQLWRATTNTSAMAR